MGRYDECRAADAQPRTQLGAGDRPPTPTGELHNLALGLAEEANSMARRLHEATDLHYGPQPDTSVVHSTSADNTASPVSMVVGGQFGELQDAMLHLVNQMRLLEAAVRRATRFA
jgi:hypothetical protein